MRSCFVNALWKNFTRRQSAVHCLHRLNCTQVKNSDAASILIFAMKFCGLRPRRLISLLSRSQSALILNLVARNNSEKWKKATMCRQCALWAWRCCSQWNALSLCQSATNWLCRFEFSFEETILATLSQQEIQSQCTLSPKKLMSLHSLFFNFTKIKRVTVVAFWVCRCTLFHSNALWKKCWWRPHVARQSQSCRSLAEVLPRDMLKRCTLNFFSWECKFGKPDTDKVHLSQGDAMLWKTKECGCRKFFWNCKKGQLAIFFAHFWECDWKRGEECGLKRDREFPQRTFQSADLKSHALCTLKFFLNFVFYSEFCRTTTQKLPKTSLETHFSCRSWEGRCLGNFASEFDFFKIKLFFVHFVNCCFLGWFETLKFALPTFENLVRSTSP